MHDLKAIRDNPEAFDMGLKRRGLPPMAVEILALDQERRRLVKAAEELQAKRNSLSKEIGHLNTKGDEGAASAAALSYTLSLHDALPISEPAGARRARRVG
jgi:seryl-tRNA synthetase